MVHFVVGLGVMVVLQQDYSYHSIFRVLRELRHWSQIGPVVALFEGMGRSWEWVVAEAALALSQSHRGFPCALPQSRLRRKGRLSPVSSN